jgi:hypothetical protein
MQISFIMPYGREVPTFLQCVGEEAEGCGKMVCPDCCGQCGVEECRVVMCRRCKGNPWSDCEWHGKDELGLPV